MPGKTKEYGTNLSRRQNRGQPLFCTFGPNDVTRRRIGRMEVFAGALRCRLRDRRVATDPTVGRHAQNWGLGRSGVTLCRVSRTSVVRRPTCWGHSLSSCCHTTCSRRPRRRRRRLGRHRRLWRPWLPNDGNRTHERTQVVDIGWSYHRPAVVDSGRRLGLESVRDRPVLWNTGSAIG
jgi:hypothetical protein